VRQTLLQNCLPSGGVSLNYRLSVSAMTEYRRQWHRRTRTTARSSKFLNFQLSSYDGFFLFKGNPVSSVLQIASGLSVTLSCVTSSENILQNIINNAPQALI
jgi:hypothetical protein